MIVLILSALALITYLKVHNRIKETKISYQTKKYISEEIDKDGLY